MTYAGEIIDGKTVRSIVGTSEWAIENLGGEWHDSESKIPMPGTWDADYGFRPEQPYSSWLWNSETCLWESPVPYPDDGQMYRWDEATVSWVLVEGQ